nr:transporter substrate-binding domain-containing protein [Bacteroidota bacterium]
MIDLKINNKTLLTGFLLAVLSFYTIYFFLDSRPLIPEKEAGIKPNQMGLEAIKKRGKLIVATERNSTGYFLYRGEPTGFEHEMLKRFAAHLEVSLEVKVVSSLDSLFAILIRGEADIIASNLNITKERLSKVNFTVPIFKTKQVLVQRIPEKNSGASLIKNMEELAGQEIHIRKNSSFHNTLLTLAGQSKD